MGLFTAKASQSNSSNSTESGSSKKSAFSTPFMQVGEGNLSAPHINKYYTQNGIVRFGNDNLYPQLLNQMYFTSGIHGACIDFIVNAAIGGGYSYEVEPKDGREKVQLKTFEKINKIKKMVRSITRDYVIHNRVNIIVSKGGKMCKFKRLDPSTIRNSADLKKFIWNSDWSRGQVESKPYERYEYGTTSNESLYVYQDESPGQDIYPIPAYNSILNWAFNDGEQAYFHKSNIQNSIFPSLVIRRPKTFSSDDELERFKKSISSKTGAKDGGRVLVLTGSGIDDTPQVTPISANNNDKLFEGTAKELKENISIAHKINPAIMGIKVAGSLGNAQELAMSYAIFEKNVIMPLREIIEEIFNDLLLAAGIENDFKINEYQIINQVVKNEEMSKASGETKSGTPYKVKETEQKEDQEEVSSNDFLRGLNAKESQDMYRIIRDHSREKINDQLAILRLKSYGMTESQAREILGIK